MSAGEDRQAASPAALMTRRIVRGMFVVTFFGIFLKLGGLLMSMILSGFYGPGRVLDAYTGVFGVLIFVFFYSSALKVIVPAFMPLFSEEMERSGEQAAWRFTNTVLNLTLVVGAAVVLLAMVFSGEIVATLVPGFRPETLSAAGRMLRFALPGLMVMLFAVMALGILNSYKVFTYPAAGGAAQKLGWAAVLFVLLYGFVRDPRAATTRPIYLGFLAGCAAQLAVLLFGLRAKLRLYRPTLPAVPWRIMAREAAIALGFAAGFAAWLLALRLAAVRFPGLGPHRSFLAITGGTAIGCAYALLLWGRAARHSSIMGRFAALAAPLLIGVIFARYRDLITAYFQSYTQSGVFGGLELAKTVATLPIELLPYSLAIAMFPYLCDLAVRKDMDTFGRLLTRTVHLIALFFVPLTVLVILLNRPIMELVFDRGNWSPHLLTYAGIGLALYGTGFFFYAVENVLMQSYFSIQRMWAPTILGIGATIFHAALLFVLIRSAGFDYPDQVFAIVAVAFPISRAAKNLILLAMLRREMARRPELVAQGRAGVSFLPLRRTAVFCAKLAVVSVAVGLAAWFTVKPLQRLLPLERFKGRTVLLDTFNLEPRDWFSHEARRLSAEGRPVGTAPPWRRQEWGHPALCALYKASDRRRVRLMHELRDLRLDDAQELRFTLAAETAPYVAEPEKVPAQDRTARGDPTLALILEQDDGARFEAQVHGTGEHQVPLARFAPAGEGARGAAPDPARAARLIVEDRSDWPDTVWAWLYLEGLRFVAPQGVIEVENFGAASNWSSDGSAISVETLTESEGRQEPALRLAGHPLLVKRHLASASLGDMRRLSFKAKATRPYELRLDLVRPDGTFFLSTTVPVRASEQREKYSVPLPPLTAGAGPQREAPLKELILSEDSADEGTLWLDNVAFERPTRQLRYELSKMLLVGLPSLAALVAFVLLCWLLRFEEAIAAIQWLRRRGWREGRKAPRGEPSAPAE